MTTTPTPPRLLGLPDRDAIKEKMVPLPAGAVYVGIANVPGLGFTVAVLEPVGGPKAWNETERRWVDLL
jgi:hypothetical protein